MNQDASTGPVCLIANVGQRDVQLEGNFLDRKTLREESRVLLETAPETTTFPMISAAIDRVRDFHQGKPVDRLMLVATDQDHPKYRLGDTIHFAHIIQRHLRLERGKSRRVTEVDVLTVRDRPHDYDEMQVYFEKKVFAAKRLRNYDHFYGLCTGGTPAANTALLIKGVECLREQFTALYVDEATKDCRRLLAGGRFVRLLTREAMEGALERHDFGAIAASASLSDPVRAVAASALARINFNFRDAYAHLDGIRDSAPSLLEEDIRHRLTEIDALLKGSSAALVQELYWNARLKWESDALADFLGRVWRVLEVSLQQPFEQHAGMVFDGSRESGKKFETWVNARPALAAALKAEGFEPWANLRTLFIILTATMKHDEDWLPADEHDSTKKRLDSVDRIQGAAQLRNKSVIAHGFESLSKERILGELRTTEDAMWNDLRFLVFATDDANQESPFQSYERIIRKLENRS